MTDLNELFKIVSEGKKQYEETDPTGQKIKRVKEHVKEDLSSLFSQLVSLKEDLEKELVVEEAKLEPPMITEEIPAQPVIHTPKVRAKQVDADVDKYLTDKSFQQPNPDLVTKNIDDIRNKIKFLEQAIGRVAAAGPGGGEVNLRYLDDVDRSTITDGWYLRYSATKKKFEFAEVISSGGNGATGPAGATGVTGSSGAQGASGLNGSTGPSGASGVSGASGANGASGIQGASGSQGSTGVGINGATGIQGASGSTGTQGASGVNGASGTIGVNGASGATGIQGASGVGSTGSQGASGSTGLTGATGNSVAASYLKYTRSAAQTTGLTAGSRVICNVSENTAGSDITIDSNSGAITLAANKTYRLRGAVPNWYGGSRPSFCWYNETTSAYIGEASFHYAAADNAGYAAGAGMAEAIITVSSSTVVSFRIQSVVSALTGLGGNTDFSTTGSYPWVDVEVISGNSPLLNGATGATGIQGASGSTGLTGATGPAPSFGSVNWAQTLGASGFSGATGATGTVFSAASFTGTGSPIEVTVCGDANPLAPGAWIRLQVYRDNTAIGTPIQAESSGANENIPYAFHVIDNPGAGTFTYSLRALASAGGGFQFGEAGTCTWTVKELSNVRGATGAQGIQGASGPNVSIPAWTSGGAITIGGTTTAPTKGVMSKDNISYRQVGAKEWEVVVTYFQTATTGAASGSGDYLFTLPNSLSFDTTLASQPQYQGNVAATTWALNGYALPSSSGTISDLSTTGGRTYAIIYNATQFRVLTLNDAAWIRCMGSAHWQLAGFTNLNMQLTFRFTST